MQRAAVDIAIRPVIIRIETWVWISPWTAVSDQRHEPKGNNQAHSTCDHSADAHFANEPSREVFGTFAIRTRFTNCDPGKLPNIPAYHLSTFEWWIPQPVHSSLPYQSRRNKSRDRRSERWGDHSYDLRRLDCRTPVTSVQIPGVEGGVATVTPSKITGDAFLFSVSSPASLLVVA